MYKILFVDDEQIVRDGIAHTIEWSNLGFEFVGAYENGTDADLAVDRFAPAVVITDICMPFGDGLELTEHIAEKHPKTKVILLSGFDEFEYARRAVRLGAYDYILKPITADELRSLLQRVHADLEAEARRSEELKAISRTLARARETRLADLTERIADEGLRSLPASGDEIAVALQDSAVELPTGPAVVVAACTDGDALAQGGGGAGLDGRGPRPSGSFLDFAHRRISIVSGRSDDEAIEQARAAAQSLVSDRDDSGRATTVGIGTPFSGAAGFADSYRAAICSLEYRFVAGVGRSIDHNEVPAQACQRSVSGPRDDAEWSDRFRSTVADMSRALRSCDAKEASESVERLTTEMARDFVSRTQCNLQIHSILVKMNELAAEIGTPPISIDAFAKLATLEQVRHLLDESCQSLIRAQVARGETYGGTKTREAIAYIERNYPSPSLSLTTLCGAIGVSPSYFSAVFKSRTGKTFVEHLTETRVAHAKQLLKTTDLRIYEVAIRVGYRDHHYFCTIFKKLSGRSPLEFRRGTTAAER